jgi:hypothetical protein
MYINLIDISHETKCVESVLRSVIQESLANGSARLEFKDLDLYLGRCRFESRTDTGYLMFHSGFPQCSRNIPNYYLN